MKKILIVNNKEEFLRFFSSLLIYNKFEVETASGGIAGFENWNRFRPDLTLTALMMADGDGFDLIKKIRAIDKKAKIIFSHGYGPDDIGRFIKRIGNIGHLYVPCKPEEILSIIQEHL